MAPPCDIKSPRLKRGVGSWDDRIADAVIDKESITYIIDLFVPIVAEECSRDRFSTHPAQHPAASDGIDPGI
jgi:hypothetical protein